MSKRPARWLWLALILPVPAPAKAGPPAGFEARDVRGWTVFVRLDLIRHRPGVAAEAMTILDFSLMQVARRLPAPAVARLREVRIWVEEDEPHHPCMAYHPDPGWLREHGMDPAKARCVEIANARRFVDWSLDQPWMTLHELAHAYHHRVLEGGFDNAEVRGAFDRAMGAKLYDAVPGKGKDATRAYAATNPQEYFAEATEAYFGSNDFYPFVRVELRKHDPAAFALLGKLWGDAPTPGARASGPDRRDGRADVVAVHRPAGEGLHRQADRHAVLGRGLDGVGRGGQGLADLVGGEGGGDPFADQGDLLGGPGGLAGLGLLEDPAHLLDRLVVAHLGPGPQGQLGDPVPEDARPERVPRLHRILEPGPHPLNDGHVASPRLRSPNGPRGPR